MNEALRETIPGALSFDAHVCADASRRRRNPLQASSVTISIDVTVRDAAYGDGASNSAIADGAQSAIIESATSGELSIAIVNAAVAGDPTTPLLPIEVSMSLPPTPVPTPTPTPEPTRPDRDIAALWLKVSLISLAVSTLGIVAFSVYISCQFGDKPKFYRGKIKAVLEGDNEFVIVFEGFVGDEKEENVAREDVKLVGKTSFTINTRAILAKCFPHSFPAEVEAIKTAEQDGLIQGADVNARKDLPNYQPIKFGNISTIAISWVDQVSDFLFGMTLLAFTPSQNAGNLQIMQILGAASLVWFFVCCVYNKVQLDRIRKENKVDTQFESDHAGLCVCAARIAAIRTASRNPSVSSQVRHNANPDARLPRPIDCLPMDGRKRKASLVPI